MLTRRTLVAASGAAFCAARVNGAVAATAPALQMDLPGDYGQRLRTAQRRAFHLHNEPETSPLHRALTGLWSTVFEQTGGALMVTVLPLNANLPLDDAEAVYDVAAGRFEMVSVAAPIIDTLVPDIGLQSLPFVYRNVGEVLAMTDGPGFQRLLGDDLRRGNLVLVPGGTFSNGFRIVASIEAKPVRRLADLQGVKIRVPPSADLTAIFKALGAVPVVTTIAEMRAAFVAGKIEAEENPPGIIPAFSLQSVTHWINMTNHIWTGFNTLANQDFWTSLPTRVRDAIVAAMPHARDQQVAQQEAVNASVIQSSNASGMAVVSTDVGDGRDRMKPVYAFMLSRFSPSARQLAEPLLARTNP